MGLILVILACACILVLLAYGISKIPAEPPIALILWCIYGVICFIVCIELLSRALGVSLLSI
jgi:multisubunit Na+/H+ antiporter MnhB subunit